MGKNTARRGKHQAAGRGEDLRLDKLPRESNAQERHTQQESGRDQRNCKIGISKSRMGGTALSGSWVEKKNPPSSPDIIITTGHFSECSLTVLLSLICSENVHCCQLVIDTTGYAIKVGGKCVISNRNIPFQFNFYCY